MNRALNLIPEPDSRKPPSRWLAPCLAAGVLALAAGCATPAQVMPPVGAGEQPLPASIPVEMAKAVLSVELTAKPQDSASEPTASEVLKNLRSSLVEDHFTVAERGGDLSLSLQVSAEEFDRTGNYYVYEGAVDAKVVSAEMGHPFGDRRFTARAPRKLGQAAAQRQLGVELAKQIAPWAQETLTSLGSGMAVADLVVPVRWPAFNQQAYATQLLEAVRGLDGVRGAHLVDFSRGERRIAIRTLYDPIRMPDGLLFTLASKHPELKLRLP